ncbi:MAG: methyltransferase domain-containing protein [Alistipes sp.]|nr:methyltransferase domain-containing protein [Alistipes sp.]
MAKIHTAERVSNRDASDNYVFQRSILAYYKAAELVSGDVLEIGTGMGYGVEVVAPAADQYVTIDKSCAYNVELPANAEFRQMTVPPLDFADESFDYVISFQVIEHIKNDKEFVAEVSRVLRKGGKFIVSTPNAPMSLTRNPWHVREYTAEELKKLLSKEFSQIDMMGVGGNEKIMEYYEANRRGVERITRFDILDLQHRLPRWMLQIPYDILNRLNRRRLLDQNNELTSSITMEDYSIEAVTEECFDLYFIAQK